MFNQKVTVYNRYEDPVTKQDIFKRTVIDRAHWEAVEGITLGNMNISTSNTITVVIPLKQDGYVPQGEFVGTGWTLKENDYIVKGESTKEITSFADLHKTDFVMVITSFEINDYAKIDRLNNYTIVGK